MSKPKPLLKSEKEVLLWQDKSEKAVLKALEKHYQEALKGINVRIAELMGRNDANLPHVIRRIEYQRMIKQQVKAALDMLHAKEYETISQYLNDAYTDAFVGAVYTQHNQDMPVIVAIDQDAAIKAVTIDTKLKTSLYEALGVDVTKLKNTVTNEITRGIASGMLYDDIIRNIADKTSAPLKRARTIVRTEAGRVMEQATYDEALKAKKAGADVVKQWSAIRDGRTRDSHRKLDGQIRELNEYFEVDGHKAMHPHGFGVAAEDVNCRCTMLTRARAALDADELKLMQERAGRHKILVKDVKGFEDAKAKDFADFKKKYLKAAEESKYAALSFMDKKKLIHDNEQQIQNLVAKKKQEEFKLIMSMDADEMQSAQRNATNIQKQIDELKKINDDVQNELGIPTNAKERFFDQKVDVAKLPQDIHESELGAVGSWTRNGYTTINAYKRTGIKTGYPGFVDDCEALEKLINRNVVKEQFTVRRGTDENALNKLFGNGNWKKEGFNANGRIIQELGFMATSPVGGGGFGSNIQMYIDVPAGAKGVYIGDKSAAPNEKEFLLQSGTYFAVDRIEESKDKWGESKYDLYLRVIVDEE